MLEIAYQGFAIFKFSEGACLQTPLENVDCWYSELLYSNLLAISIFIETPGVKPCLNFQE